VVFKKFQNITGFRNGLFARYSLKQMILLWPALFLFQKAQNSSLLAVGNPTRGYIGNKRSLFLKVLIIRGIGYRGFLTLNDFSGSGFTRVSSGDHLEQTVYAPALEISELTLINNLLRHEITSSFYLTLRAGHTEDASWGVSTSVKSIKKNRKLVLASKILCYTNYIANCA